MKIKMHPLQDRLLVQRLEEDEVTSGGIVIPESAKEKPIRGKVMAVGPGKMLENGERRPLDLKTGDKVLFTKYGGTEVKLDGEELLVLREDDVLAVLD